MRVPGAFVVAFWLQTPHRNAPDLWGHCVTCQSHLATWLDRLMRLP